MENNKEKNGTSKTSENLDKKFHKLNKEEREKINGGFEIINNCDNHYGRSGPFVKKSFLDKKSCVTCLYLKTSSAGELYCELET